MKLDHNTKLGWIGTGVMGEPLCAHLMAAAYPLAVHSRTREKAAQVVQQGAVWSDSPAQLAVISDVIFTMVGSPDEVEAIYFGADGLMDALRAETILVDMGTTPPALSQEIERQARQRGAHAIDAPVSGGDVGARNASLSIMAGGDEAVFDALQPLFDRMGKAHYMGPAGSGQHTKMCNQITVAGTMIGVCEALLYARQAGLDADKLVDVIARGAAGCWTLDNLAPRINRDDLEPGFMVNHFVKDLGIALTEVDNLGLTLPGTTLATELYQQLQSAGQGERGTQALILALKELNRLT